MPGFAALSPELLEQVFAAGLDGPPRLDHRNLARWSAVSSVWASTARRLKFRWITVDSPEMGAKLVEALRSPTCAACVRSLVIKDEALDKPDVFSDLSQDDLLRLSTNLVSFDSVRASFAPLPDGRKTLAAYPSTLTSMRLGQMVTTPQQGFQDSEDDDDDDAFIHRNAQNAVTISKQYLSLLRAFPSTLTSLKLSKLPPDALPHNPPDAPLNLPHLSALYLDFLHLTSDTFKWLTETTDNIEVLQVWLVTGVSEGTLLEYAQKKDRALKQFFFKPKGQGKRVANELVLYMPALSRLSLGDKACDHAIWNNLPASLTHLCVALPNGHRDARLTTVANELTRRLTRVQRLELYSQLYFPPPVEVEYPPMDPRDAQDGGLRELRLSHVASAELEAFVRSVGRGLYTLAVHHLPATTERLLPYCPRLRRLELGAADQISEETPDQLFESLHGAHLTHLRVHLASYVSLARLTASLSTIRAAQRAAGAHHRLAALELVGHFPDDLVGDGWRSGGGIDALACACEREGVALCVNGRQVESVGDMWAALLGQTGREAL
ncbi:hypothetical protein JCM10450v2_007050 [Rhodotorula kratochvilovae]